MVFECPKLLHFCNMAQFFIQQVKKNDYFCVEQ